MDQKKILSATAIALFAAISLFFFWRKSAGPAVSSGGIPALAKKWEFTGDGKFTAALALADDGTIYAVSEGGFLYALNPSGALKWKAHIGAAMSAPAIGPDGAIYIANNGGRVFAVNPSGDVRWTTVVYEGETYGKNGSALGPDYLYVPARGSLCAVRLSNGQVDWKSGWGGEQWGSVTLLPDSTLLSPGRGRLNGIDSGGELAWQYPSFSPEATERNGGHPPPASFGITSGIAVDNNRTLYVANGGLGMVAVGMDGTTKWELKANALEVNRSTPVIAADGTIFFAGASGILYAVNPFGITKWSLSVTSAVRSTPVLAQDGSIFLVSGLYLCAISPDGRLLSKSELKSLAQSSPTLAPDGTVVVATDDGRVLAYAGGHGGLMNSAWPKYQADLANSGNARAAAVPQ